MGEIRDDGKRLDRWFYKFVPWNGFIEEAYRCLRTEIPRVETELALTYSLMAMGHVLRGWIEVASARLRTNYYLLVIGDPATAKTVAWRKIENNLLKEFIEQNDLFIAHTGASFEGLARVISEYGDVIHFADEVQRIFRHRKGSGYLADIIDLWKMAWNGYRLQLPRRSREKSIYVGEGYMFSVLATTTPSDLEDVLETLGDPALIRRFLPISSRIMARYGEGEPADWTRAKLMVEFTRHVSPVHFIVDTPILVPRLTDTAVKNFGVVPGTWLFALLDTYTIKTASILAWDRLLAYLTGKTRGIKVSSTETNPDLRQSFDSVHELLHRLDSIADKTMSENFIKTPPLHTEYSRTPPGDNRRNIDEIIQFVEDLSKYLIYSVEGLSTTSMIPVEGVSRLLLETPKIPLQGPPQVFWGPRNQLYVVVDNWDLVRGFMITFSIILHNMELYNYLGMDAKWAYFVRRLKEISQKYDTIDLRLLARYMKRFKGYNELVDYVMRAVTAGILQPTTEITSASIDELLKIQFRISPFTMIID